MPLQAGPLEVPLILPHPGGSRGLDNQYGAGWPLRAVES